MPEHDTSLPQLKNETDKWQQVITDEGDCWILPPGVHPDDMHAYFMGDMESTDGCCFEQADFVIKACNNHNMLLDALKQIAGGPCCESPGCCMDNPSCDTMIARAAIVQVESQDNHRCEEDVTS